MGSYLRIVLVLALVWALSGCNAEQAPEDSWVARHNITATQFSTLNLDLRTKGYKLTYLNGQNYNGQARYNAIWRVDGSVPWLADYNLTGAEYQNRVSTLKQSGYQPVMVNPFNVGGSVIYTAIYERRNGANGWAARHGMSHDEYQQEYNTQKAAGYRLVHVAGYNDGGTARYAAIWENTNGPSMRATHGATSAQYQDLVNSYKAEGFAPVLVDGFTLNGVDYFSAIWHKNSPRWSARHEVEIGSYQDVFDEHYYQGYYPVAVSGYGLANGVKMAAIYNNTAWNGASLTSLNNLVENYRTSNGLSGLSIAITIDERLVYARGFGLRDPNTNARMTTSTVGRIASTSKAITGAAASRLMDEGALNGLANVFGAGGLLEDLYPLQPCRVGDTACQTNVARLQAVQALDVLEHTIGGWSNSSSLEPCSPLIHLGFGWNICNLDTDNTLGAASRDEFLQWIVQNIPLMQAPNGSMIYSNVGYNIAEQLIEAASGMSYEQYINQNFIQPSGSDCKLAQDNNTLFSNEIVYAPGAAYTMNHRRMAGHGGWVCSPIGYLRLMTRLDGGSNRPDLFSANAFSNIFTNSQRGGDTYAKGIRASSGNLSHNGALRSINTEYRYWANDRMSIFLMADTQVNGYNFVGYTNLYNSIRDGSIVFPGFDLF